MRLILAIFIFLIANQGWGQHDEPFKFLKKNQKLNRDYLTELNRDPAPVFVSSDPPKNNKIFGKRKKLNIYPYVLEGDPRYMNPDLFELKYNYQKFDMGDLILNILKPVGGNLNSLD